ncbi:MAG: ABC transporter permease [Burkholderiaceae bacterium]|nr:MAG: ABC transporter permease [Burkholderiaceae bacterium]
MWIALRNVLRYRRNSAVSVAVIVFGISAMVVASGFIEWVFWAMREAYIESQYGHVRVVKPGYLEYGQVPVGKFLLSPDSSWLEKLKQDSEVRAVVPRLSFTGMASVGDTTIAFLGEGVDPGAELQGSTALVVYKGHGLGPGEAPGIIVGEGLARQLGVSVGEKLALLSNTRSGGLNAVELPVQGIFYTANKNYDDVSLRIPIETAQKLLRVHGAQSWLVMLKETHQTTEFLGRWRGLLPADQFALSPWTDQADFYNKTVTLFSKQVNVIRAIIAAIIVLAISNTLSIGIMERTTEIGTSMALGANRRRIQRQFVLEGCTMGLLGAVIGALFALLLSWVISKIGIPMPPPPGMTRGFVGAIRVDWKIMFDALAIAWLATLAASFYPAWRASRLDIVDALRKAR